MRYLPALLAKLWPPAPLQPIDTDMDHHEADAADPITSALEAAVGEHERAAAYAQDNFARHVRDTLDELLERIGTQA